MTTTVERADVPAAGARQDGRSRLPGWPLVVLFVGFPAWWALGLAQVMFFVVAAVMAVTLIRQRKVLVPPGFSLWLLFLIWMLAGAFVLWAQAPGTVSGGGAGRLIGFGIRALWYLTATIVMLYVLNTARHVSRHRIVLLLGYMFVITTGFGLAAMIAPEFEFRSLVEIILPDRLVSSTFVRTLVHPSLASSSDFLGYEQPRPTAPFPYSNAWGNNVALYAPFFVYGWFGRNAGWRRKVAPLVLIGAIVPIAYSLNRGLWLALAIAAIYAALRLAVNGNGRGLLVLVAAVVLGGGVFVSTPLYDTVSLRIDTPHSNDRRTSVASEVIEVTAAGSPFVGYGTTRQMQGSFASLAGGGTPECRQCAPPPLGTQGFIWRLVLTTGFVGTLLCLGFLAFHFLRRCRGADTFDIVACSTLLIGGVCFFVYDSLGSALVTILITVGLMSRVSPEAVREASP